MTIAHSNKTYPISQCIRRYKATGTVVDVCADAFNGYIIQTDTDEPRAVIMAAGYLLRPAS